MPACSRLLKHTHTGWDESLRGSLVRPRCLGECRNELDELRIGNRCHVGDSLPPPMSNRKPSSRHRVHGGLHVTGFAADYLLDTTPGADVAPALPRASPFGLSQRPLRLEVTLMALDLPKDVAPFVRSVAFDQFERVCVQMERLTSGKRSTGGIEPLRFDSYRKACFSDLSAISAKSADLQGFSCDGGGGNRTRVRGRTEQSIYERSSP